MTSSNNKTSLILIFYLFGVVLNHSIIALRLGMPFDIHLFSALTGGLFNSLFFPFLLLFPLTFLSEKKAVTIFIDSVLILLCFLPFLDLLYFNVTFSRFNWSVTHDLNYYGLKASFMEILNNRFQLLPLSAAAIFASGLKIISSRLPAPDFKKLLYRMILVCIFLKFFFPFEEIIMNSNFTPIAMKTRGKNTYLAMINQGNLKNFFFLSSLNSQEGSEFINYTDSEREKLVKSGLIPVKSNVFPEKPFKRVIILIFESLALEYFKNHNHLIPSSASSFFDKLDSEFPSSNAYFTSAAPTLNGLYAMLNSRIPFLENLSRQRMEKSLPQLFKEKHGCKTFFIRGVSKFYGGENAIFKNIFGFDNLITYEELALKFPEPGINSWGFHDDIVLKAAEEILIKEADKPLFMLIKLIDMHQPPYFCGIPSEELPDEIARHPCPIIKSIYWGNHLLEKFYETLKNKRIINDETIFVVTADHYPPLGYGHLDIVKDSESNYLGRIPLIFVSSRIESLKGIDRHKNTCQLDLAPTLCSLGGIEAPDFFLGQSIINENAVSRKIGLHNDLLMISSPIINYEAPINSTIGSDSVLKKWILNLYAKQAGKN